MSRVKLPACAFFLQPMNPFKVTGCIRETQLLTSFMSGCKTLHQVTPSVSLLIMYVCHCSQAKYEMYCPSSIISTLFSLWMLWWPGAYPGNQWTQGGVLPEPFTSLSQSYNIEIDNHSHILTPTGNLEWLIILISMFCFLTEGGNSRNWRKNPQSCKIRSGATVFSLPCVSLKANI